MQNQLQFFAHMSSANQSVDDGSHHQRSLDCFPIRIQHIVQRDSSLQLSSTGMIRNRKEWPTAKVRQRIGEGLVGEDERCTFKAKAFLKQCAFTRIIPILNLRDELGDLIPARSFALLSFFGDKSLDKITPEEVERYKTSRAAEYKTVRGKDKKRIQTKQRLRPATVNRELTCLRAMFNQAIKSDVPLRNPISKTAAKVLPEDNEQTRVLSYDEQEKYLAKATPMMWEVAMMMLETGMRPEEVFRIQSANVSPAENYLFNPYGKTKAAKRRIKLTETAKSILVRRKKAAAERESQDKGSGAFLFPCETDATRPLPGVQSPHARALRENKVVSFRPYDCRHTWATRAAQAGIDLVTLAAMLGHSKINMVLRYAHPTQEHQAKAMDMMERYVSEQKIAHAERAASQISHAIQ
jgi:integrase